MIAFSLGCLRFPVSTHDGIIVFLESIVHSALSFSSVPSIAPNMFTFTGWV